MGSNKQVQQSFVTYFNQTNKCKLFLSGHSHNFEHFEYNNKQFVVIGGGGGIEQNLNTSSSALNDIAKNYKPHFHFLALQKINNTLHLTSYKINASFTTVEEGISFNVNL